MKIVFMGTPDFAVGTLHALVESEHEILAVVTQPDKPKGRGKALQPTPVKEEALRYDIPVYQPKRVREEEFQAVLRGLNPDLIVVVAFGQLIPKSILELPRYGCVNVHASLLPKYRGANPIQRAIINGDKETGICTMITELGLDCGDVCIKKVIPISQTMNCEELFEEISECAPMLLEKTLTGLVAKTITPTPQCENGVCMANKLTKEETVIDWTKSAEEIHNLVRGIYKFPSAHFIHDGKLIKVLQTSPIEGSGKCGEILGVGKDGVKVACGKGCLLLIKVKPEGKSEMNARDWYNGLKSRCLC